MKVGSLVTIKPSNAGLYIITSRIAYDPWRKDSILPDTVMLTSVDGRWGSSGFRAESMREEHITVLSE